MDDFLRAKAARARAKAAHGAKRKRDLEELEARERKAAHAGEVGAERAARERLRGELERLRRRREEATRGGKARDGDGVGTAATTSTVPEHLYRALKVVWRRDGDAEVRQRAMRRAPTRSRLAMATAAPTCNRTSGRWRS